MSTPGRHIGPQQPREDPGDAGARSTWNSGSVQAGERILGEVDKIQSRLSDMAGEVAGEATRLQRLAMLGEISGFVAHEFNNILTPLLAHAQVALRQPRDPERMALALERVVASVKRATAVAESILELAKQDADEGTAVPRGTVDGGGQAGGRKMGKPAAGREGGGFRGRTAESGADVARCVRRATEEAGGEGARIEVEAGLRVMMEEHDLQQVVLNLLLNARRANAAHGARNAAAGEPGGRIIVRGGPYTVSPATPECSYIDRYMPDLLRSESKTEPVLITSDNLWCAVEVEDRGGGVAAGALRTLRARGFEVVESGLGDGQGDGQGDGRGGGRLVGAGVEGAGGGLAGGLVGGSGLGLEICRRVVEGAGGWIEIESRAGVGTIVRVHLRRAGGTGSAAA